MKTKIIIFSLSAFIILSCDSEKERNTKYLKTSEGRLKSAQFGIQFSKEISNTYPLKSAFKELDSIKFLFPYSKDAKIADSLISIKDEIYTEIESQINKETRSKEDSYISTRIDHETYLRNFFLESGYDIKVKICGEKYSNIVLTNSLFNDVWFRKFETQGLFDKWAIVGFKKITLTDGYHYSKSITYE